MARKINVIIPHSAKVEFGLQAVTSGFVDTNSKTTIKDILKKELKDKYTKIKSYDGKIEQLMQDVNNAFTKEMLFLDLEARNFKVVLRTLKQTGRTQELKNATIVAKYKEPHSEWNGFNAVALFTNLVVEKRGENDWVTFVELRRIEFLRISHLKKTSAINIKQFEVNYLKNRELLESESQIKIDSKGQKTFSDHLAEEYKQAVDIFDHDKTRLDLKKNSEFISSFLNFLKTKQKEMIPLFSFEEIESNLDSNLVLYALLNKDAKKYTQNIKSVNISNGSDSSNKFQARIVKRVSFNHIKYFEEQIEHLRREIQTNDKKINSLGKQEEKFYKEKTQEEQDKDIFWEKKVIFEELLEKYTEQFEKFLKEQKVIKERFAFLEKEKKRLKQEITKNEKVMLLESSDKTKSNPKLEKNLNAKRVEAQYKLIELYKVIRPISKEYNEKNAQNEMCKKTHKEFEEALKSTTHEFETWNAKFNITNEKIKKLESLIIESKNKMLKIKNSNKEFKQIVFDLSADLSFVEEGGFSVEKLTFEYRPKDGEKVPSFFIEPFKNFKTVEQNKEESWILSTFDFGLFTNFKRFDNNIKNLKTGHYKNPYLAIALDQPSTFKSRVEIKGNYKLNDKQRSAVDKALSTDDIAYIQGPPGTGKTQTIAVIANEIINSGGNVLVSSSTHAAIDNFFERLDSQEADNPNIFMLKYTFMGRETMYGETNIFNRFLKALDINVIGTNSSGEEIKSLIEDIKNYDDSKVRVYKYYSKELNNFIQNKINDGNLGKHQKGLIKLFSGEELTDYEEVIEEMEWAAKKTRKPEYKTWKDIMQRVADALGTNELFIYDKESALKALEGLTKTIASDKFKSTYSKFLKFKDKTNDKELKNFNEAISKNDLLNAIGITTTSRKSFDFNGKTRKIFTEYPVECVIIDEVSKSVTPEIISNSFLAKKVLLTGDYRQLPPGNNIDQTSLEEYYDSEFSTVFNKIFFKSTNFDDFKDNIDRMFSNSLFKNQIKEIKTKTDNKAYEFLNTQYRFHEDIMDIVNISYDENEKLIMPAKAQQKQWSKIKYKVDGAIQNKMFEVVDTSNISEDFIQKVQNAKSVTSPEVKQITEGQLAFDQSSSIFSKNIHKNARFNEYNAFVISRILESILKENPTVDRKDIGVIAMTRSQASIINNELRLIGLNGIKVDTVDNFQGSEREIIIVDLVRAPGKYDSNGGKYTLNYPKTRDLSFYKKIERLNVAVSRGRSKVIVVGAIQEHLGKKVISEIETNGKITPKKVIGEYMIKAQENGGFKTWK
ncbi:AAA domain-containing protein [Mycoplasma todarodis]|uniref:AAA domain-containing protein n=1 Tax=Mycoplasma todarodis TaxID=1937191 RepID=UPI003B2CB21F